MVEKTISAGSVIIFVSRKGAVDELATNLQQAGFPCKAMRNIGYNAIEQSLFFFFTHVYFWLFQVGHYTEI